jgi:DNA-binding winged helix-turn-helix (wHTH) protein
MVYQQGEGMEYMSDRQEQTIRLDLEGERLWCGAEARRLRPKSFAVLRHLVAQAGRVVSKEELLEAVWPGTTVSDGVLKVCLSELRQALGDTARGPQYIETVPRRGYRWIGPFSMADPPRRAAAPGLPATGRGPLLAVGREAEGTQLHAWLAQARHGTRQVGFLTGAAGTGKTTVVDVFLAQVAHEPGLWLARGQCVDHYGVGKPYLPVLEALGQLGRGSEGPAFLAVLRRYAPMWLAQFPGLVSEAELERVQRQVQGATPARMLRELAEALEVLTADILLVFVLEDLHWSDPATLECLAAPAQRREPARLLVVGTYRPVELGNRGLRLRGLVQELIERGYGVELPLALLPAEDVAAYMARRLEGPVASPLAAFVHERTEGHALFMASLVEHLIQEGLVAWQGAQWRLLPGMPAVESVPKRVWQFIVRRF